MLICNEFAKEHVRQQSHSTTSDQINTKKKKKKQKQKQREKKASIPYDVKASFSHT